MVAIKDMNMPSCCGKCKYGQRFNPDEDICRIDGHIIKSTFATITQNRDEKCPLIGIEERKVGKWIKSEIGGAKVCSICQSHMGLSNFKYCPNCGAEMVGAENG